MSNIATPLQAPADVTQDLKTTWFVIRQQLLKMQTFTLVEVNAVHGGGVDAPPTVDVTPLVGQVDGAGNVIPHKTIFGRPCMRIQGGGAAIIADPLEGDVGVMAFASRDISAVIASDGMPSPPGSRRTYSYADGTYLGGALGGAPLVYVGFIAGITLGAAMAQTTGNFSVATGATGTFTTPTGQTVDVQDGIITGIF